MTPPHLTPDTALKSAYRSLSLNLHPGSLAVAIAFDLLWSPFEISSTLGIVTIIFLIFFSATIFVACLIPVTLIQRLGSGDEWTTALTKGLALATLAAIPYSFIGLGVAAFWGFMRLTYGVDQEVILLGKLARGWREIENTLRRLTLPELRNAETITIINDLHDRHLLSHALASQLHDLRRQRNANLHETSTDQLASLVDQIHAMQATLRTRFLRQ